MELLEDLESRGHVFVIRPQVPVIKNTEDRVDVLTAFYQHGYEYAEDVFEQAAAYLRWDGRDMAGQAENRKTEEK